MLIDGIHVPLTAPFYRDGKLYLRKLEHNVARYSLSPVAGLLAFDPRLEAAALSDAEAADSLTAIREMAAPEKVLIAAIQRDSVAQALTLAAQAHDAMFDAVALAAPPSWPMLLRRSGERELLNFFRTVADNSPLPVMLWSDAATPSLGLTVDTIAALSQHPNILGLYDADLTPDRLADIQSATSGITHEATVTTVFRPVTRRMLAPAQPEPTGASTFVSAASLSGGSGTSTTLAEPTPALKTRTRKLGFQILSTGAASTMLPLLQQGAAGALPVLASPAPQAVHEAYAAHTDGNPALAAEKAARLSAADALLATLGPAAIKYAQDLTGYFGGLPRLPLLPLDATERTRIDQAFRELRN